MLGVDDSNNEGPKKECISKLTKNLQTLKFNLDQALRVKQEIAVLEKSMEFLSEIDLANANSKILNMNQEISKLNQEINKIQEKINVGDKTRERIDILKTQEPSETNISDLNAMIRETENLIAHLQINRLGVE